jgi:putative glutamine amidotransferase
MDSNSQAVSDAPRIAIPVPTTGDLDYNRRSWAAYAEAVRLAGGEPVEVPLSMAYSDLTELAAGCQGILLPGSPADVNPDRYGQERIAECAPADAAREAVDLALLEDAYQQRKPIFAICFGFQVLNAWRGGTLIQDLTVMPVNHVAGRSVAVAHSVMVAPESLLGEIVKEQEDGSKPEEAGPFEISEVD